MPATIYRLCYDAGTANRLQGLAMSTQETEYQNGQSDAVVPAGQCGEEWNQWVSAHIRHALEQHDSDLHEAIGEAFLAERQRERREREQELASLRRELCEEIGLERGFRSPREEVEQARKEVPKLPATVSRLEAEQARLQRELDKTKKDAQQAAGRSVDCRLRFVRAPQGDHGSQGGSIGAGRIADQLWVFGGARSPPRRGSGIEGICVTSRRWLGRRSGGVN
jgi:hypothetical protein